MIRKVKENKAKRRIKIYSYLYFLGIIGYTSLLNVSARLGDIIDPIAKGVQKEVFGAMEAAGLFGLIGAGIFYFFGNVENAKKLAIGVVVSYFVLKYGTQLWSTITGII